MYKRQPLASRKRNADCVLLRAQPFNSAQLASPWNASLTQNLSVRQTMSSHHHEHDDHSHDDPERWKHQGVRVIKGDRLDANTAQTPGMFRQAACPREKGHALLSRASTSSRRSKVACAWLGVREGEMNEAVNQR